MLRPCTQLQSVAGAVPCCSTTRRRPCRQQKRLRAEDKPREESEPDQKTYPSKDMGGATGGWAGGEVGLRRYLQESEGRQTSSSEGQGSKQPQAEDKSAPSSAAQSRADPRKYPGKETVGVFSGITGGFAGGERGLAQFVDKGDLKIAEERQREFSPLILAGVVAVGVTFIALLANQGENLAELQVDKRLGFSIGQYSPGRGFVLTIAFGLAGLTVAVTGLRFASRLVQRGASGARSAGLGLATTVGFWAVVLLLAKVILDSPA